MNPSARVAPPLSVLMSAVCSPTASAESPPRTLPDAGRRAMDLSFTSSPSHDQRARNWNDAFQQLLAEPDSEDKFRDIALLANDFVYAAMTYAKIIVSEQALPDAAKTIPPIQHMGGVAGGQKFLVQNILFKFALDVRIKSKWHSLWMYGGADASDEHAMKAAAHELRGLCQYFSAQVPGLHFPLLSLIDYKGFRVIAVSVLPIRRDTIRYGSCDSGVTVHARNDDLNAMMQEAARHLNLAPHVVGVRPAACRVLAAAGDIEAHIGDDGKYYVLDFARSFPPEAPCPRFEQDEPRAPYYKFLRPELVRRFKQPLSSDAYTAWGCMDSQFTEHNTDVLKATYQLFRETIPSFARRLSGLQVVDIHSIILSMHREGINIRHLGQIRAASNNHFIKRTLLLEMVVRVIKNQLRAKMREEMRNTAGLSQALFKKAVIDSFNLVLGTHVKRSRAYWEQLRRDLCKKFYSHFTGRHGLTAAEETGPIDAFRRSLSRVQDIFARVSQLVGVKLQKRTLKELQDDWKSFEFVESDVETVYAKTRAMDIIDFFEGMAVAKTAQRKTGREKLRLLDIGSQKFSICVSSTPSNFTALFHWSLVLIAQADAIRPAAVQYASMRALKLREACDKLEACLDISPKYTQALVQHAMCLLARAELADSANVATPLYQGAALQLSKALSCSQLALRPLKRAAQRLAQQQPEHIRLLGAVEMCAVIHRHRPHDTANLMFWALCLIRLAVTETLEQRVHDLGRTVADVYVTALKQAPQLLPTVLLRATRLQQGADANPALFFLAAEVYAAVYIVFDENETLQSVVGGVVDSLDDDGWKRVIESVKNEVNRATLKQQRAALLHDIRLKRSTVHRRLQEDGDVEKGATLTGVDRAEIDERKKIVEQDSRNKPKNERKKSEHDVAEVGNGPKTGKKETKEEQAQMEDEQKGENDVERNREHSSMKAETRQNECDNEKDNRAQGSNNKKEKKSEDAEYACKNARGEKRAKREAHEDEEEADGKALEEHAAERRKVCDQVLLPWGMCLWRYALTVSSAKKMSVLTGALNAKGLSPYQQTLQTAAKKLGLAVKRRPACLDDIIERMISEQGCSMVYLYELSTLSPMLSHRVRFHFTAHLQTLDLSHCRIDDAVADVIAKDTAHSLTELNLCRVWRVAHVLRQFAAHNRLLTVLNVSRNGAHIGDEEIALIVESFKGIVVLDVSHCGPFNTVAIEEMIRLRSLSVLRLAGTGVSNSTLISLFRRGRTLTELDLSECRLTDTGSRRIVTDDRDHIDRRRLRAHLPHSAPHLSKQHAADGAAASLLSASLQQLDFDAIAESTRRHQLNTSSLSRILVPLTNLQKLSLANCRMITHNEVLKVILCLTSLVEIDLSHMPQLDVDVLMSAFCAKSSIASNRRKIDLRGSKKLSDLGVTAIAEALGCPSITQDEYRVNPPKMVMGHFAAENCFRVSDTSVLRLARATRVTSVTDLNLSLCRNISESALRVLLSFLPYLTSLSLHGCPIQDATLFQLVLSHTSFIRDYDLSLLQPQHVLDSHHIATIIQLPDEANSMSIIEEHDRSPVLPPPTPPPLPTAASLTSSVSSAPLLSSSEPLRRMKERHLRQQKTRGRQSRALQTLPLRRLDVAKCADVTPLGLSNLLHFCPDLRALNVSHCDVSFEVIKTIGSSCPLLEDVNVAKTVVSDAMMEVLTASLTNLKTLALWKCYQLSDASLQSIARHCLCLEHLNISENVKFSNWHLARLRFLPLLRSLDMSRCRSLRKNGLKSLCASSLRLRDLKLQGLPLMSDEWLKVVAEYGRSVRSVDVTDNNLLSTKVVEYVQIVRPDLTVVGFRVSRGGAYVDELRSHPIHLRKKIEAYGQQEDHKDLHDRKTKANSFKEIDEMAVKTFENGARQQLKKLNLRSAPSVHIPAEMKAYSIPTGIDLPPRIKPVITSTRSSPSLTSSTTTNGTADVRLVGEEKETAVDHQSPNTAATAVISDPIHPPVPPPMPHFKLRVATHVNNSLQRGKHIKITPLPTVSRTTIE